MTNKERSRTYFTEARGIESTLWKLRREMEHKDYLAWFYGAMHEFGSYDPDEDPKQYTTSWADIYEDCGGTKPRLPSGVVQ